MSEAKGRRRLEELGRSRFGRRWLSWKGSRRWKRELLDLLERFLVRCWILLEPSLMREESRVEASLKRLLAEGNLEDSGRSLAVERDEVGLESKW